MTDQSTANQTMKRLIEESFSITGALVLYTKTDVMDEDKLNNAIRAIYELMHDKKLSLADACEVLGGLWMELMYRMAKRIGKPTPLMAAFAKDVLLGGE